MTARRIVSLMTMAMVTLGFVTLGHCQAAIPDDNFAQTCARVLRALRSENWKAFRQECADEIVLEKIQRIYLQTLSRKETKELFREPDWINSNPRNGPVTAPEEANDRDLLVTHGVLTNREPTKDERRAFHQFCSFVRDSYAHESAWVDQDRNLRGGEVKSLFGPAIEGKVASNFKWRVQFEEIDGRWRVRKLITEAH